MSIAPPYKEKKKIAFPQDGNRGIKYQQRIFSNLPINAKAAGRALHAAFVKNQGQGIPKRNSVARSTLLYQGNQETVSSCVPGSPMVSEKLVFTPLTL